MNKVETIETIKKFLSFCDNETYLFKTPIVASAPHYYYDIPNEQTSTLLSTIKATAIFILDEQLFTNIILKDELKSINLSHSSIRVVKEPIEKGKFIDNKMEPLVNLILRVLEKENPEYFEGDKFGFFEHKLNEDRYTNMMEDERWERDKTVEEIVKFFKYYENDKNLSFDPPLENEYIILYRYDKHSEDFHTSDGKITVYIKKSKKLIQYTFVIFLTTYHLYNKSGTNIDYNTAKNILELLKERNPEYFEGDKFGFFEHLKTFKTFENSKFEETDRIKENLEGFFNFFKDENNKVILDPPIYIEDDFTLNGEIQIWRKYIRYFLLFHDTLRIYWSNDIDSSSCDGFFCIGFTWLTALIKLERELSKRDEYNWYFEGLKFNLTEKITLDIEEGDVLLGGKFKNKQVKVKEIGKDDKNQPTINGKPLLKFRIFKQLPQKDKKRIHLK